MKPSHAASSLFVLAFATITGCTASDVDEEPAAAGASELTSAPTPFPTSDLGMGNLTLGTAEAVREAALLKLGWLRTTVHWSAVEPTRGTYRFGEAEELIRTANELGIKVLIAFAYAPSWASLPDCTQNCGAAPGTEADYAAAAARFAGYYDGKDGRPLVSAIEIWNEPNQFGYWKPRPDVDVYANVVKKAYPAIKAANPHMTVIAGVTSGIGRYTPSEFWTDLYARGVHGSFDAVSHHPYAYSDPRSYGTDPTKLEDIANWGVMFSSAADSLASLMASHGDGDKAIWATETGFPTGGAQSWMNETNARQSMENKLNEWMNLRKAGKKAGPLIWFNYKDIGTTTNDGSLGLTKAGWTTAPACNGTGIHASPANAITKLPYCTMKNWPRAVPHGTGLTGEYFNGEFFGGPVLTRVDPTIDFVWGTGSPDPRIGPQSFSVRWTGAVEAPSGGDYTFLLATDEGVRMWLDDRLVIDHWELHTGAFDTATAHLEAGVRHGIRIDYREHSGNALARFFWVAPNGDVAVVPKSALYPR